VKLQSTILLFLPAFVALAPIRASAATKLDEPQLTGENVKEPTFGDDESVSLLAELLADDDDPLIRQRAALDLGKTHNSAALPHLLKAMSDECLSVRAAAVVAAAEIGGAAAIVTDALKSEDTTTLLAALRGAAELKLTSAGGDIRALLSSKEPVVRAAALTALTRLGLPAESGRLKALIADRPARVRLAALANALLLKDASSVLGEARRASGDDSPAAIRLRALEILGARDFESSRTAIEAAARHRHPLVRKGAALAYYRAGRGRPLIAMLKDDSPTVRLVAIRAMGELNLPESVGRLFELMLAAPDSQSHLAARRSLRQIGGRDVATTAARCMREQMRLVEEIHPEKKRLNSASSDKPLPNPDQYRRRKSFMRNAQSCSWLLGELKSTEGFEYQLHLVKTLEIDSPILVDVVPALGKIGDRRAVGPLLEMLKLCKVRGVQYLVALLSMSPPPPYSETVTARVIEALAALEAHEAVDTIAKIVATNVRGARLTVAAAGAARALPKLLRADNRDMIETVIVDILSDKSFSLTARFFACKAAGSIKPRRALEGLRMILDEQRPGRLVMRAAAWAIQEITGTTPEIPQPRLKPGDWIITKASR